MPRSGDEAAAGAQDPLGKITRRKIASCRPDAEPNTLGPAVPDHRPVKERHGLRRGKVEERLGSERWGAAPVVEAGSPRPPLDPGPHPGGGGGARPPR